MSSSGFASTGDLQAKKISFSEVGSGLYAFTAEGDPNSGIIVGDDSCLVMDAQATPAESAQSAGMMGGHDICPVGDARATPGLPPLVLGGVRQVTNRPINYVV